MSEHGWKDFLSAEGVDDWAVLHGGATAVFRVRSIRDGAALASALAEVPGLEGSGAVITLGDGSLSVRLRCPRQRNDREGPAGARRTGRAAGRAVTTIRGRWSW